MIDIPIKELNHSKKIWGEDAKEFKCVAMMVWCLLDVHNS